MQLKYYKQLLFISTKKLLKKPLKTKKTPKQQTSNNPLKLKKKITLKQLKKPSLVYFSLKKHY